MSCNPFFLRRRGGPIRVPESRDDYTPHLQLYSLIKQHSKNTPSETTKDFLDDRIFSATQTTPRHTTHFSRPIHTTSGLVREHIAALPVLRPGAASPLSDEQSTARKLVAGRR